MPAFSYVQVSTSSKYFTNITPHPYTKESRKFTSLSPFIVSGYKHSDQEAGFVRRSTLDSHPPILKLVLKYSGCKILENFTMPIKKLLWP